MKRSKAYLSAIIIAAVLFSFIIGCDKTTTNPTGAVNCDSCLKAAGKASFISDKLYKLKLTYQQYLDLKNSAGGGNANMIVFQFVYNKSSSMPVTLVAYAARPNHTFTPTVIRYLDAFEEVSFTLPPIAIFGDQQVRFATIQAFLAGVVIDPVNTAFVFTPTMDADGVHVRYDICLINPIKCTDAGVPTQPSPPADANP